MKNKTQKAEVIERIEEVVIQASDITAKGLYSDDRAREFVDARQAVWYVAHELLGYSASYLARLYGKDHTTVLSGINRIKADAVRQKAIVDGIAKHCPEVMNAKLNGKQRPSDSWKF